MSDEEMKEQCPNLWAAIQANIKTYFFYNGSIKLVTHSEINKRDFIQRIENEKYMIYFKSFEIGSFPQNLN